MQKVRKWYEENRGRKLAVLIFAAVALGMRLAGGPLHEVLTIKNFIISAVSVIVHMVVSEPLRDLIQRGRVPVQRSSRQGGD